MMRKHIVVGDCSARGGTVLPFKCAPPSSIDGCQIAFIGSQVSCGVCNSVGHIAKAGGPYRPSWGAAENALEGDMVVCECATPSPLISTLGGRWRCDDRGGFEENIEITNLPLDWYHPNPTGLTSSKEAVSSLASYPDSVNAVKTICPDKTDEQFFIEVLGLRDRAIFLIGRKTSQLGHWDDAAKADVLLWFGRSDGSIREFLITGLKRTVEALKGLSRSNFVRYSDEFEQRIVCAIDRSVVASAAVCRTDIHNRIIGIAHEYCQLRIDSGDNDSKLSVLIHEITHFEDIFDTDDPCYGLRSSLAYARKENSTPQRNADSIVGYIMWGTFFGIN